MNRFVLENNLSTKMRTTIQITNGIYFTEFIKINDSNIGFTTIQKSDSDNIILYPKDQNWMQL